MTEILKTSCRKFKMRRKKKSLRVKKIMKKVLTSILKDMKMRKRRKKRR